MATPKFLRGQKGIRWAEKKDKTWLGDMYREVETEVRQRPDPARERTTCSCGHSLSKHYMGTRAMPCSQCQCMYAQCEGAETIRKDKAQRGVEDITPLSRVFRRH